MRYITLLPWLLFFSIYTLNAYIEIYERNKTKLKTWFHKNFWKMFRLDILLLIIIFIFFLKYKNNTVNIMLFFMINLYLFINSLYDIVPNKNTKKIIKQLLISFLLVVLIPFLFYYFTKNFVFTCLIMFAYTFFAYIIVILLKKISIFWGLFSSKRKKRIKSSCYFI